MSKYQYLILVRTGLSLKAGSGLKQPAMGQSSAVCQNGARTGEIEAVVADYVFSTLNQVCRALISSFVAAYVVTVINRKDFLIETAEIFSRRMVFQKSFKK